MARAKWRRLLERGVEEVFADFEESLATFDDAVYEAEHQKDLEECCLTIRDQLATAAECCDLAELYCEHSLITLFTTARRKAGYNLALQVFDIQVRYVETDRDASKCNYYLLSTMCYLGPGLFVCNNVSELRALMESLARLMDAILMKISGTNLVDSPLRRALSDFSRGVLEVLPESDTEISRKSMKHLDRAMEITIDAVGNGDGDSAPMVAARRKCFEDFRDSL